MKKSFCSLTAALVLLPITSALNAKDLFIEEAKKSVVFIFQNEQGTVAPVGTGFLAGVRARPNVDEWYMYLVTAKHVLTDEAGVPRPNLFIRLNKKETGSEFLSLRTSVPGRSLLTTHTSPLVDIAAVPVTIDDKKFDIKFVQDEILLSREGVEELEISEGSEVFFTGLFVPFFGQGRNYPIVRTGKVALLTGEKIPWRTDPAKPIEFRDLFLLETQSFGGNSGSPVFVVPQKGSRRNLRLIGVMMGTFEQGSPISVAQNSATAVSKQNLGIAAVVPAYFLKEILFGESLSKMRAEAEAASASTIH